MIAAETLCQHCENTGWVTVEKNGNQVAHRCQCQTRHLIRAKGEKVNIPPRFLSVSLAHYHPDKRNPSQEKARKRVETFLAEYPAVPKGLLFQGPTGVGKTHLMCCIAVELMKNPAYGNIYYIDWNDLVREMRYGDHTVNRDFSVLNRITNKLTDADLLLFDELGASLTSPWVLDNIYYIINKRYNDQKITLCATNYPDQGSENLETLQQRVGERIRSRLYDMTDIVQVGGDDYRRH